MAYEYISQTNKAWEKISVTNILLLLLIFCIFSFPSLNSYSANDTVIFENNHVVLACNPNLSISSFSHTHYCNLTNKHDFGGVFTASLRFAENVTLNNAQIQRRGTYPNGTTFYYWGDPSSLEYSYLDGYHYFSAQNINIGAFGYKYFTFTYTPISITGKWDFCVDSINGSFVLDPYWTSEGIGEPGDESTKGLSYYHEWGITDGQVSNFIDCNGTSWRYRVLATISNESTAINNYSSYQVSTLISNVSASKNAFKVVFYNQSDYYEIPSWVEPYNLTHVCIWWLINYSVDPFESTLENKTSYYIYYSNTTQAHYGYTGNDVFELFDDFEDNSFDTDKWTEEASGGSYSETNGILSVTGGGAAETITSDTSYSVDTRLRWYGLMGIDDASYTWVGFAESGVSEVLFMVRWEDDPNIVAYVHDGSSNNAQDTGVDATYTGLFEIRRWTDGTSKFYIDDELKATPTKEPTGTAPIKISVYKNGLVWTWHYIFLTKFDSVEPVLILGAEEEFKPELQLINSTYAEQDANNNIYISLGDIQVDTNTSNFELRFNNSVYGANLTITLTESESELILTPSSNSTLTYMNWSIQIIPNQYYDTTQTLTISATSNDYDESSFNIYVTFMSSTPNLTYSLLCIDFGDTQVDTQSTSYYLNLTNTGSPNNITIENIDFHANFTCLNTSFPYVIDANSYLELYFTATPPFYTDVIYNRSLHTNATYPATFSFETDAEASVPEYWVDESNPGSNVTIADFVDGHSKVLHLQDSTSGFFGGGIPSIYTEFSAQTYGTIEFWWRCADIGELLGAALTDGPLGDNQWGPAIGMNNTNIFAADGDMNMIDHTPSYPLTWFHIRIEFNCTAYTYDVWVNNVSMGTDCLFVDNVSSVDRFYVIGVWTNAGFEGWADSIAFSWDSDYTIGDNFYPSIGWVILNETYGAIRKDYAYLSYLSSTPTYSLKYVDYCTTGGYEGDSLIDINYSAIFKYISSYTGPNILSFLDLITDNETLYNYLTSSQMSFDFYNISFEHIQTTPDSIEGMRRVGNLLYVARGNDNLYIYNITYPKSMTLVGYNDSDGAFAQDLDVLGDLVYMVAGNGGLIIYNASNFSNIYELDKYQQGGGVYIWASGVKVVNDVAFVSARRYDADGSHLYSFNVSDPTNIILMDTLIVDEYLYYQVEDIYIIEDVAYLCGDSGVHSVNISNASNLVSLCNYTDSNILNTWELYVENNLLYVASQDGLLIFNVSNASNIISLYNGSGNIIGLEIVGDLVYLADAYNSTISVFNISDPSSVTHVKSVVVAYNGASPDLFQDIRIMDGDAFLISRFGTQWGIYTYAVDSTYYYESTFNLQSYFDNNHSISVWLNPNETYGEIDNSSSLIFSIMSSTPTLSNVVYSYNGSYTNILPEDTLPFNFSINNTNLNTIQIKHYDWTLTDCILNTNFSTMTSSQYSYNSTYSILDVIREVTSFSQRVQTVLIWFYGVGSQDSNNVFNLTITPNFTMVDFSYKYLSLISFTTELDDRENEDIFISNDGNFEFCIEDLNYSYSGNYTEYYYNNVNYTTSEYFFIDLNNYLKVEFDLPSPTYPKQIEIGFEVKKHASFTDANLKFSINGHNHTVSHTQISTSSFSALKGYYYNELIGGTNTIIFSLSAPGNMEFYIRRGSNHSNLTTYTYNTLIDTDYVLNSTDCSIFVKCADLLHYREYPTISPSGSDTQKIYFYPQDYHDWDMQINIILRANSTYSYRYLDNFTININAETYIEINANLSGYIDITAMRTDTFLAYLTVDIDVILRNVTLSLDWVSVQDNYTDSLITASGGLYLTFTTFTPYQSANIVSYYTSIGFTTDYGTTIYNFYLRATKEGLFDCDLENATYEVDQYETKEVSFKIFNEGETTATYVIKITQNGSSKVISTCTANENSVTIAPDGFVTITLTYKATGHGTDSYLVTIYESDGSTILAEYQLTFEVKEEKGINAFWSYFLLFLVGIGIVAGIIAIKKSKKKRVRKQGVFFDNDGNPHPITQYEEKKSYTLASLCFFVSIVGIVGLIILNYIGSLTLEIPLVKWRLPTK